MADAQFSLVSASDETRDFPLFLSLFADRWTRKNFQRISQTKKAEKKENGH